MELEYSLAKLGQIPKHTHTHTRRKRQRRSGEETVELRGQMKECWSVDVFFTIALCHISNTDCLKRTIYISQSFTASGWDGSRGKNNVSRRKSGVTGFTERKEKAMLRERLKSRRYKQEFLLAASLCLCVCVCVCTGVLFFLTLGRMHLYDLNFLFPYWIHLSVEEE